MPTVLGLDKKKWLWIGVAVAGVAGLYLLMHRGGTSADTAGSDVGLPQTGPPQMGNMTPQSFFDPGEQAAFKSSQDRFLQMRAAQSANDIHPTGIVSGIWQQLETGDWRSTKNPSNIITEQMAQQLGPQNHGPYAQGGGGFFQKLGGWISNNLQAASKLYAGSQGLPLPPQGPAYNPHEPSFPQFTPPIAPMPGPLRQYGNNPGYTYPGQLPENY